MAVCRRPTAAVLMPTGSTLAAQGKQPAHVAARQTVHRPAQVAAGQAVHRQTPVAVGQGVHRQTPVAAGQRVHLPAQMAAAQMSQDRSHPPRHSPRPRHHHHYRQRLLLGPQPGGRPPRQRQLPQPHRQQLPPPSPEGVRRRRSLPPQTPGVFLLTRQQRQQCRSQYHRGHDRVLCPSCCGPARRHGAVSPRPSLYPTARRYRRYPWR